MKNSLLRVALFTLLFVGCSKDKPPTSIPPPDDPGTFVISSLTLNDKKEDKPNFFFNAKVLPSIKISFTAPIDKTVATGNIILTKSAGGEIVTTLSFANKDSSVIIQTSQPLEHISKYQLSLKSGLQSVKKVTLKSNDVYSLITVIDSTDKFPRIPDEDLLTLIQKQSFKYFWDFGHPLSGMARERNTSGDLVTTGGTGFGLMSMIVGIERNFITRSQGLERVITIVDFLKNKCTTYHGAFSHWLNGATGATMPFSANDDAADLVETSLLMQGLLTVRQYFKENNPEEILLRNNINSLWKAVEWEWFRQNGQNVLYWHWSPKFNFEKNLPIKGWNESLVVYVLASSSPDHSIPKEVYEAGWASNGNMKNGNTYFGTKLPLGPNMGGPLFFAHYSFLGINPTGLIDSYANYFEQNKAHSVINFNHCVNNPGKYNGYSMSIWGLTASDDNLKGYMAHSPTNDDGVISPTAAISSMPYTPEQSIPALKFFYYVLGDKLFKEYGFIDAFNLSDAWFSNSFLAIDQGPQIVMIENYRTGLLWDLFMSSPEVKTGMAKLGFKSPFLP